MKLRAVACLTLLAMCAFARAAEVKQDKTRVLFEVGGRVHDAVQLPAMLKDVLERTGYFTVTISQDRDLLKAENIKNYDLVMFYTTRGDVTKDQERGLVEFTEKGGAVVAIHSSTSSYPSSDACWKLIGGRFLKHGAGTFTVKITGKRHAIVQRMSDFSIKEETYCNTFHPEAKLIVLMRRETDGEPVSWVQYYGEGRVFVTALGHDKRTWENLVFQDLIKRGSLWAAKRINP